jgi:lipoyl synthase
MIRLSAGTAISLGLSSRRFDARPTTAYLLSGDNCRMNCTFCPRGTGGSKERDRLGRINWPEYSWDDFKKGLALKDHDLRRICLQSVRHAGGLRPLLQAVDRVKKITDLPLSLSAWLSSGEEAAAMFDAGVDRISIALDVANPSRHQQIKGSSLSKRLDLLLECAEKLPGRMSTHLICGLGETEEEMLSLIARLIEAGVTVALFAFFPLRGTVLANHEPPDPESYRRIQAGYYLLHTGAAEISSFQFAAGELISFGLSENELFNCLADGKAFQTSGCPDCNRPFYNERPGGFIYNFPRPLEASELQTALNLVNTG